MQHFCNSWHVSNLFVMVSRFNRSLKLVECMVSLHIKLLRPSTNILRILQLILYSLHVIDCGIEDSCSLPQTFVPKDVHLRQLAT
jgi:hypothetical protein